MQRRQTLLTHLFNGYMYRSDFTAEQFCPFESYEGKPVSDIVDEELATCNECRTLLKFKKPCGQMTDKSLRQKCINVLRAEGYID